MFRLHVFEQPKSVKIKVFKWKKRLVVCHHVPFCRMCLQLGFQNLFFATFKLQFQNGKQVDECWVRRKKPQHLKIWNNFRNKSLPCVQFEEVQWSTARIFLPVSSSWTRAFGYNTSRSGVFFFCWLRPLTRYSAARMPYGLASNPRNLRITRHAEAHLGPNLFPRTWSFIRK